MSKFTPGPWKAGSKSVSAPESEDRLALDVRIFGGNKDDNKANARLIAAAPEMLKLIEALLKEIDARCGGRLEGNSPFVKTADEARALIAKVNGN